MSRKFKGIFRPKLGDLQKKKKKKRSSPKFGVIFPKFKRFFRPKAGDLQKKKKKKKKKGLRQNSGRFFFQSRKFKRLRGGSFRMGGGYFPFFTENRPQKHKKHAILHTSQANGPPPGYATACVVSCNCVL